MYDGKIEIAKEKYLKDVKWLKDHVPLDDIYDFAQQAILASECFLSHLAEHINIYEEIEKDDVLMHWVNNITSLYKMKKENFNGIVNVESTESE